MEATPESLVYVLGDEAKDMPVDRSRPFSIEWGYYQQLLNTIEELRKDLKYFAEVDDINEHLVTRCARLRDEINELKETACAFCGH